MWGSLVRFQDKGKPLSAQKCDKIRRAVPAHFANKCHPGPDPSPTRLADLPIGSRLASRLTSGIKGGCEIPSAD
jgi:hypothetical protein